MGAAPFNTARNVVQVRRYRRGGHRGVFIGAEQMVAQRSARMYSPGVTPAIRLKCRWS